MNPARTREIALALTSEPSVTDSDGESRFAFFLRDLLLGWPYFAANPGNIRLIRTVDDVHERYALAAFAGPPATEPPPDGLPAHGRAGQRAVSPAIILTGHYDVVSVENYGSLAPFAFNPDALALRLVAALESEASAAAVRGERSGETDRRALEEIGRAHV